ncbi:MAG: hypothetical protein JXX29_04760 [Deltaproteobacteria bacterium]|nr:hypothetical protein [Deltaproteobacteria bacterium]MBN2670957.1 hypothetical protein [Deltaproteobacteria bacterium]
MIHRMNVQEAADILRMLRLSMCTAVTFLTFSLSASAQTTQAEAAVPSPPLLPMPVQKPTAQHQVEAVMGRNMDREYQRYAAVAQYAPELDAGFADFLYDEYTAKRNSGIVLAGVATPLVLSFTALGVVGLYRAGARDEGGFCNHEYYDEFTEQYETDCKGDYGEVTGIILISTVGGLTAAALFLPGLIKILKYNKRIRRLEPLVAAPTAAQQPSRFTFGMGPRSLSLSMQF